MAVRPVFSVDSDFPFYRRREIEFTYHQGFATVQKQKNIAAIHTEYKIQYPEEKVLEISSKSMQEGGVGLSAFNLLTRVSSLNQRIPVETVYQAGKVFAGGGPYTDLMTMKPKDAKRDERLKTSGPFIGYEFEGEAIPTDPTNLFYDWLYIRALIEEENRKLAAILESYDAFTDIEFNPNKSLNSQARAAAIYISLKRADLLEQTEQIEDFRRLITGKIYAEEKKKGEKKKPEAGRFNIDSLKQGDTIVHPKFGEGRVTEIKGNIVMVAFRTDDKKLSLDFVKRHCEKKS